ncbi:MAG: UPF0280 family protein [Candidatus Omnitrophica bacterium]|nr:UPF0280 family protein [Candidatus Omnitrophota bacterium]
MNIIEEETDLDIFSDKEFDPEFLRKKIKQLRHQIQLYAVKDERFINSLCPLTVEKTASFIVRQMSNAGRLARVGPMAAVAGAIAEALGRYMLRYKAKEVIVENGGDIFVKVNHPLKVGIYAGESPLNRKLRILIRPKQTPLGICTSSATVGHSFSLGQADSVVILAKSAAVADAVATATCNQVKEEEDIPEAIEFAKSIPQVRGCIVIYKNKFACWGEVEFV